ncbi:MAG TPA: DUF4266 domain-containing protein [Puia sp.]|nr:DUF4266 domain-containing protein [Puia sp.]
MKKKALIRACCAALTISFLASCVQVKEYQKSRINDSEMTLANRKVEKNELNAQSYREGSSGANGGKTGGGCGCN